MSFDGITTRCLIKQLKNTILNGKIDKIYQQEKDEILMYIHNLGKNYKLLISASSHNSRIYLTNYSKSNPQSPPMFCMLLRKFLQKGTITDINQVGLDRIIIIDIQSIDEIGEISTRQLIIEIMGKHSNIILINKSTQIIIDSIKRIPSSISRIRQILPGIKYEYPPNDKLEPMSINEKTFLQNFEETKKNFPIYKYLYTSFTGLSPLISREICFNANVDTHKTIYSLHKKEKQDIFISFKSIINKVLNEKFYPNLIKKENSDEVLGFYGLDIKQYETLPKQYNDSISCILEKYYLKKDILDRINQKSSSIKKSIHTKLERAQNKLSKQKNELLQAKKRDKFKIYADLISANIYKINKGIKNIELENFYTENLEKIIVPLDPKLSASQNAQKYYKKYTKLKNAYNLLKEQIFQTSKEIEYLENILVSIENCTELNELEEIKEELIKEGYMKGKINKKNKKQPTSKPHHYISSDGYDIFVGKNNKQNDNLTIKFANKNDMWLHTKQIPGSHVIIKTQANKDFPKNTLHEAALLAAFYSKGKQSQNVPVDYTERKNVKKPNNAKPGMVIYVNNNTIYVTPKKEYIKKIKKIEN